MIEAGQIDDYAIPDGAARHTAAGSTWDQWRASLGSPLHECRRILGVSGNGDSAWNRAAYPRRLRVDRASEIVLAKDSTKARWRHNPRLLTRGGFVA